MSSDGTRRPRTSLLASAGAVGLLAGVLAPIWIACGLGDPRPDILLVTLDTTRADRIGAWGWPSARTPAIDALASEGVRFARAYARCR